MHGPEVIEEAVPESHCPERLPRWIPRHASTRVGWSLVAGVVTYFAMRPFTPALRMIAAWDAFALVLLAFVWAMIWSCDSNDSRKRAKAEDPGRTAVWVLILVASSVSFFASGYVLRQAKSFAPGYAALWIILCLGAVALSWVLSQTSWTLRYAHLYYRDDREGVGGLQFPPGDREPDDFDFAYYAFTIGMTFQVSDVVITSPQIRRATLMHGCMSFAYNTAIIALALNLASTYLTG
ncbi:MAG: DUF1345 domain-containing protein [Polyangiales bacterium]